MTTSINKQPVAGPIAVGPKGILGDTQSDRSCHGGTEMALCFYPQEHYPHLSKFLQSDLPIPSFGENITSSGMLEEEVCIGDTFRIGEVEIQISLPRMPCATLAKKHAKPELVAEILDTAYCGWYVRVLKTGEIESGMQIALLDRPNSNLSVGRTIRARHEKEIDPHLLEKLSRCPALTRTWRERFAGRLSKKRNVADGAQAG